MTGLQIIEWAIRECTKQHLPPTDANLMMFIREWVEGSTGRPPHPGAAERSTK